MNDVLHLQNQHLKFISYNLVKKEYCNGIVEFKKTSFDTFVGISRNNHHNGSCSVDEKERFLQHRVKERREKITDLALNNNWEYFVTITFDPKNKKNFPDGYNHDQAIKLLTKWINNQNHQNLNMSYLLVSEFHKKGQLHFHGLFKNVPKWILEDAINSKTGKKVIIDGVQVYNLVNYKHGFTTVSKVQDSERVSHYVAKYVTKELVSLPNKKVFWYSRDLLKPKKTYHYVDSSLAEFNIDDNFSYYDSFGSSSRSIEVAISKAT